MTFEEIAPGIIVAGYLLVVAICVVRSKLVLKKPKEPAPQFPEAPPTENGTGTQSLGPEQAEGKANPPKGARERTGDVLLWAAWLVGIATTVCWIGLAWGWTAALITTGVLVGLVVIAVIGAFIATLFDDRKGTKEIQRSDQQPHRTANAEQPGTVGLVTTPATAQPRHETVVNRIVWGVFGLLLVADFLFVMLQPLLYLIGLGTKVRFHVDSAIETTSRGAGDGLSYVRGSYPLDGTEHNADILWLAWGGMPEGGATIDVAVVPFWPSQIFAEPVGAWVMIGAGVIPFAVMGIVLLIGSKRTPKRRVAVH